MPIDISHALLERPAPLDFVLPGLVVGTVGAIVSPGGAGKSALALQIVTSITGGPDLIGFGSITRGRSAYLPGEDPEIAIRHRLFALGEKCSRDDREAMANRLFIEPLDQHMVNIMDSRWFEFFTKVATGRRLLILDTLRMVHQLDENNSGDMTEVVSRMRSIASSTNCAIVFLHHTNKSSATSDQGAEQQASRGSSVLVDNIRWQAYLRGMPEAVATAYGVDLSQRRLFVEFGVSKQNYGPPFEPIWLEKVSALAPDIAGGYTLQRAALVKPRRSMKEARGEFSR